jgi:probable H4MPT-linked C1 transfer pathway protein
VPDAVVGWDLGGAHLKAVLVGAAGEACAALQLPCPLWQGIHHLEHAIDDVCRSMPAEAAMHAVTMTGEMADLFADRAHGVEQLVAVLQRKLPGARISVFAGRRGFVAAPDAAAAWRDVASANWLATAMFAAQRIGDGILVDVGSTTTDIIPFAGGVVCARGVDDRTRLAAEELVYTGIVRTPVMAMAAQLPFAGDWIEPMAEHFATAADVYRLTGELPEDADLDATADGRGKSLEESARRLARMIGCDADVDAPRAAWTALAEYVAELQLRRLHDACSRVFPDHAIGAGAPLVGAGVGSFVVRKAAQRLARPYVDFSELAVADGVETARIAACAPAFAVAYLVQSKDELNLPFDKGGQREFATVSQSSGLSNPPQSPFFKGGR